MVGTKDVDKRNTVPCNITLEKDLVKRVDDLAYERKVARNVIVTDALELYLKDNKGLIERIIDIPKETK